MQNPIIIYIGDATEVFLPVVRRDVDQSAIASVAFGVYTAETGGSQQGSTVTMAWEAAVAAYVGIYPSSDSANLTKWVPGGTVYYVRITATGYTHRVIPAKALYRGRL